ncbi:hypothetical protein HYDPIDRAFT_172432 [Hydnomerulius pinastri MD-312]|nr:hypothetical protein HYDPIDRAFT_172432 [Hydnomerulius pinastri MD-312]
MSESSTAPRDDRIVQAGIEYWETQPASLDGVLGGFGSGSLPRVDALGSRQFLLDLLPELSTVPSSIRPLPSPHTPHPHPQKRTRALDVGAGIGRVTSTVLLPLTSDVVLLEPVRSFIEAAHALCAGAGTPQGTDGWPGIRDKTKSVSFVQGPLQDFDPSAPRAASSSGALPRLGYVPPGDEDDADTGFDVVWCQWCLGHLNDADLVAFLERSKRALREHGLGRSVVVVKENLCSEGEGVGRTVFDEQDSSWTRSDLAFKKAFADAGLKVVREKIQRGLPEGLYPVKMYVPKILSCVGCVLRILLSGMR